MPTVAVDLFTELRALLMGLIPGVEIVKGMANDVPMPLGAFISMTGIGQRRLATNRHEYLDLGALTVPKTALGTVDIEQPTAYEIQVDCYGPLSSDWAATISTVWRDIYAADYLRPFGISPLYADDQRQIPLQDSSQNYEERWVVMLTLQHTQTVTAPMNFFDTLPITFGQPL